ncbi:hypothetical protein AAHA92_15669 [Salvia divinorum]|uniref:Uncharacterized protein n=1 Tax=Salvia divinorum TaxID=28513 RepID=A0ABD1HFG8_SALDI
MSIVLNSNAHRETTFKFKRGSPRLFSLNLPNQGSATAMQAIELTTGRRREDVVGDAVWPLVRRAEETAGSRHENDVV